MNVRIFNAIIANLKTVNREVSNYTIEDIKLIYRGYEIALNKPTVNIFPATAYKLN